MRHGRWERNVQDVVVRIKDRFPAAALLRRDEQLQGDGGRNGLAQYLLYDGSLLLVHVVDG